MLALKQLTLGAFVLLISSTIWAGHKVPESFNTLTMKVEENVTDGDTELVILAKTESEGLAKLVIRGPDHHIMYRSRSKDSGDVGIREYALETAEPPGNEVLNAYPEGHYSFVGRTFSGQKVVGVVELHHDLPGLIGFIPNGDIVNPAENLTVQWDDLGAAFYLVEIENDDLEFGFTVQVPGTTTSLQIAGGTFAPDTEYEISIAVINEFGNVSVSGGEFSTSGGGD